MCSVSGRVASLVLFLELPQAAQVWNLKYLCTHTQTHTHARVQLLAWPHCAAARHLWVGPSPIGAAPYAVQRVYFGQWNKLLHECAISCRTSAY